MSEWRRTLPPPERVPDASGYAEPMARTLDPIMPKVRNLVDDVRSTCLWYLREDYYPTTVEQILRILDAIERHGDVAAFRRAAEIRSWLSRHSSAPSAGS